MTHFSLSCSKVLNCCFKTLNAQNKMFRLTLNPTLGTQFRYFLAFEGSPRRRSCKLTQINVSLDIEKFTTYNFSGAEIFWIDSDPDNARLLFFADFVDSFAFPNNFLADVFEGSLNELPHAVGLSSGNNKIFWRRKLQHQPHCLRTRDVHFYLKYCYPAPGMN